MADKNGLQMKADYIPGKENGTADSLSRLETAGDYFNSAEEGMEWTPLFTNNTKRRPLCQQIQ
jgi:hypothetical protein